MRKSHISVFLLLATNKNKSDYSKSHERDTANGEYNGTRAAGGGKDRGRAVFKNNVQLVILRGRYAYALN